MTKQRVTRRKRRLPSDRAPPAGDGTRPGAGAANSAGSSINLNRPPVSNLDGTRIPDGTHFVDTSAILDPGERPLTADDYPRLPGGSLISEAIFPDCSCGILGEVGLPGHAVGCSYRLFCEGLDREVAAVMSGADISTSDRYKPGVLGTPAEGAQPVGVGFAGLGRDGAAIGFRALHVGDGNDLPLCSHGNHLRDGAGEALEPMCGCRVSSSGLDDILRRLDDMTVLGSCMCMTKQKRPSAHGTRCPYRVMREAAVEIRVLRPKSERGFPLPIPDPADLQRRLHMVTEGSCSCHKRGTPAEVAGHRPLCRYRLLKEAEEVIWLFIPEVGR